MSIESGLPHTQSEEKGQKRGFLKQALTEAGFDEAELPSDDVLISNEQKYFEDGVLTHQKETFLFLKQLVNPTDLRRLLLRGLINGDPRGYLENLTRIHSKYKRGELLKFPENVNQLVTSLNNLTTVRNKDNFYNIFYCGITILSDDGYSNLFESAGQIGMALIRAFEMGNLSHINNLFSFLNSNQQQKEQFTKALAGAGKKLFISSNFCNIDDLIDLKNGFILPFFRDYLLIDNPNWADKIYFLKKVLKELGLYSPGISYQKVEEQLLITYIVNESLKRLSEEEGDQSLQQIKQRIILTPSLAKRYQAKLEEVNQSTLKLKPGEKQKIISKIRKKITPKTLASLTKNSSSLENDQTVQLNDIQRLEHPLYPVNALGLSQTVGYEIEFKHLRYEYQSDQLFRSLQCFGFLRGGGGDGLDETSPGPFLDPKTACLVFKTYLDAGLIDLNSYTSLTYHFNVGLRSKDGLSTLIWNQYLTGAAFDHRLRMALDSYGKIELRIHSKPEGQIDNPEYYECKCFDVITASGFIWNMCHSSYLAWALDAYHKAQKDCLTQKPSANQIVKSHLTSYEKSLALIWYKHVTLLETGLSQVGLESMIGNISIDKEIFERFTIYLNKIFPNYWSRFNEPGDICYRPINLGKNVSWPNIVAFTRNLTEQSVREVLRVRDNIDNDAIKTIVEVESSNATQRMNKIEHFLDKFGPANSNKLPYRQKVNTYTQIKDLYFSTQQTSR